MIALLVALQIPAAAWGYRAEHNRSAYREFGPGAPTATLAAQIHQESGWNPAASSWVGAVGLAQFMPGTAKDMAKRYPALCAPANPLSPRWALTCRDRYLHSLYDPFKNLPPCSAWAFALRAYNGGLGWVYRDRHRALEMGLDANDWLIVGTVNAGRRASAHKENKEYPERIYRIAPRYENAGWGGKACG